MVKIRISIQSISDLITNSSSEVFCRICSQDSIEEIYNLLEPLFGNGYRDECPRLYKYNLEDEKEYLSIEDIKKLSDKYLEIDLPYELGECSDFFKAGLEAVLDKYFENNYTIEYYD